MTAAAYIGNSGDQTTYTGCTIAVPADCTMAVAVVTSNSSYVRINGVDFTQDLAYAYYMWHLKDPATGNQTLTWSTAGTCFVIYAKSCAGTVGDTTTRGIESTTSATCTFDTSASGDLAVYMGASDASDCYFSGVTSLRTANPYIGYEISGGATESGTLAVAHVSNLNIGGVSYDFLATTAYTKSDLAGALTFSGALASQKDSPRTYTGALTFSGALANFSELHPSFAGALTFASALNESITISVAGAVSFVGGLGENWSRTFDGVITFSGGLVKNWARAFAGAITFAGAASGTNAVIILRKIFGKPNPSGKIKSGKRV
jgi:hypothetical protein